MKGFPNFLKTQPPQSISICQEDHLRPLQIISGVSEPSCIQHIGQKKIFSKGSLVAKNSNPDLARLLFGKE